MTKFNDNLSIRGNVLKNRIVMLPMRTFSFNGDEGNFYGQEHIDHYTKAAKGGTGLIILEATDVSGVLTEENQWTKYCQNALKTIAYNTKFYGAKVMMQLFCGGDKAIDINKIPKEDIEKKQKEMLEAAIKSYKLGFDGVEYHFAHGFYLCKFLDSRENKREDNFGGSLEKRTKILTDILAKIRENTGDNFIIGVRMGSYMPSNEEGIATAKLFEEKGVDLLDISFGMEEPTNNVPSDFELSHITYSGYIIKQNVNIPVIGVYHLRTPEEIEILLKNEYADLAGVGRGILADSDFTKHLSSKKDLKKCLGCNPCFWYEDHTKCPAHTIHNILNK
ncbi:MAG: hypothetical protein LBU40_01130 [Methanobrevibacter sp.]|jgi:2,4-dienoyl-CoA reductase-like NADH-dependent reductase (Old Yellow Enzyme family)|nr:hypothetical protein [Methanobrevibacter sp.]